MNGIQPQAGDYGEPRVLVPAPEDPRFAHLAWPKITRTHSGVLILAYLAGEAHTRGGSPAVSISTDDGDSFSPPRVLQEFDESKPFVHSGNIALGVAEDGGVVLLAMALSADWKRTTIVGWRSEDDGGSWEPTDTSVLASTVSSVYGHVFEVPERGLAVAGHYRPGSTPGGRGIWLAFSQDHGRSWGKARAISHHALYEPAFCYVDEIPDHVYLTGYTPGRILGLARDDKARYYRRILSRKTGTRWRTRMSQVGGGTDLPSPFIAAAGPDHMPGYVRALHTERNGEGREGGIYLWTGNTSEFEWEVDGQVAVLPETGDYGYPWMTQLDEKHWMLAFYCGEVEGPNSIWGMRVKL
jgi:hypothetical protein